MLIDLKSACGLLLEHDNFEIFAHQKPDGDTFGASFALMWALTSIGKKARVSCCDGFSERYGFIYGEYSPDLSFEPNFTVAVDIASLPLLGGDFENLKGKIDLCIDHHKSNTRYAKKTLLDAGAPAACLIIFEIIDCLGVKIDEKIATALFTGISTDTGCFKYANVTSKAHIVAAKLIDFGANHALVNKLMFDTKSRGILKIDQLMTQTMQFYFDGKCALIILPADITTKYEVCEEELDGISAFPVRIEGVYAGITIRAKENNTYRISLRTVSPVDASKICALFGGGGHMNAAGCTYTGDVDELKSRMLNAVQDELKNLL